MNFEEIKNRNRDGATCCGCTYCDAEIAFLLAKIERMQKAVLEQLPVEYLSDTSRYPWRIEVFFTMEDLQDFFDVEVKNENKRVD